MVIFPIDVTYLAVLPAILRHCLNRLKSRSILF